LSEGGGADSANEAAGCNAAKIPAAARIIRILRRNFPGHKKS